ncbi:MAG: murein L,D-transpeptidase [Rhodomicrobium sp.]|nr:MAG: murein L,D-transpeptidase [Rhodomicrobium sp.]
MIPAKFTGLFYRLTGGALSVFFMLIAFTYEGKGATPDQLKQAIVTQLETETMSLPLPVRQQQEALKAYYIENDGAPLWIRHKRMTSLVEALRNAELEGLSPGSYPTQTLMKASGLVSHADASGQAVVELYYSAFFLRFARDLKVGRLLPRKVDPKLYWQEKAFDAGAAFRILAGEQDMGGFIRRFQPQIKEYIGLKRILANYRQIEKAGGWQAVPHGDVINAGDENASIPAIYQRLAVTDGELKDKRGADSRIYDEMLVEAVRRFQKLHGLEPDGVIGKQTVFALNISVRDRIRQIIVTMERWRWKPEQLGAHHILVNLAGYELRRVRNGKTEEVMRVAVGKPYHQSPVFSDKIKYLEFNPYWNVPRSIAVKEELPKLKANPGARAARGFEAVVGDNAVPLTAIDWGGVTASNFKFRIRQRPGPKNALGRVKFMFPNKFNVYLHDTPARSLFNRAQRAFSHGCIRLARPLDLAEQLLESLPGWSREKIVGVLNVGERKIVNLAKPVPVHLTYSTVWLDEAGRARFSSDIYGRDARLEQALAGRLASF